MTYQEGGIEQESPLARRDYIGAAIRMRWLFVAPLFVLGLAASIVARVWPVFYRSEAMILLEQQKIPEQFVTPNVIVSLQNRLEAMKQRILSRSKLQDLIERFGLYQRERSRKSIGDLIEELRKKISVDLVPTSGRTGEVTGIRVSFAADTAGHAQQVTMELVVMFIEESLKTSAQQSANTTEFLETQLDEAHSTLDAKATDLRQFKTRYIGELPEQEQSNLQVLSSIQTQIYAAVAALEQSQRERVYYESIIDRALAELQRKKSELLSVYTPQHPQVVALDTRMTPLFAARGAENGVRQTPAPRPAATGYTITQESDYDPTVVDALSHLTAMQADITSRRKDVEELRHRAQNIQDRLNMTAVRAQEFLTLNRAVEDAQANYQSLLQKKLQSQLASNLQKKQQSDEFRILDPASLPERSEGRTKILLLGWGAGGFLGVMLLAFGVLRDTAIRDEADITCRLEAPVFQVPMILQPGQRKRLLWLRVGESALAAALAIGAVTSGIQTYLMG